VDGSVAFPGLGSRGIKMARLTRVFPGRMLGRLACAAALASTALVSSCKAGPVPLATIDYAEVSVCAGNSASQPDAPSNLIILVFEITSISNTDSGATSFTFNPSLLYLNGDNGHDSAATNQNQPGASGLSLTGAPFGFARTLTVAAGATTTVNAGVVVTDTVTANSPGLNGRNTTNFLLLYATAGGSEGVLLVKTNNSAARYPTVRSWGCPNYL
jgi:hypothetical protein